ncbi:MAG TPA: M23 family metallopeptidase [Actinobacteria bacterium]|nr:M23 family metallopeptidase [Actinomycetota bacterium]
MIPRLLAVVLAVLLVGGSAIGFAADTDVSAADVAAADRQRRETARRLEAVAARYEAAVVAVELLETRLAEATAAVLEAEREIAELRREARRIAVDLYVEAGFGRLDAIVGTTAFVDVPVRSSYLGLVAARSTQILERLVALEAGRAERRRRLAADLDRRRALVAELETLEAELTRRLDDAETAYREVVAAWEAAQARARAEEAARRRAEEAARRRAEEAARRRATTTTTTTPSTTTTTPSTTTTPPDAATTTTVPTGGIERTCPVDGATTFTDTWGAPRSGGRRHKGVDMIAPRGTPLVAVEAGRVSRLSNSTLGGISVYLTGRSGSRYYYAHLDAWAPGLAAGDEVALGEPLGIVGNTGNASYTVPHLHFQYAPPGEAWVNPYPLVDGLCR